MKATMLAVGAALLVACSTPDERKHQALMALIERQIPLPEGALPLEKYARYYADEDNGDIVGIYLIPMNYEIRPGETCEELDENLIGHEVPCNLTKPAWYMPAGNRRWVGDHKSLPFINDGGCAQVTVIFDKKRSIVTSVDCNGEA